MKVDSLSYDLSSCCYEVIDIGCPTEDDILNLIEFNKAVETIEEGIRPAVLAILGLTHGRTLDRYYEANVDVEVTPCTIYRRIAKARDEFLAVLIEKGLIKNGKAYLN